MRRVGVTVLLCMAAAAAQAAPDAARAELGGQLYVQMCRQCHGAELRSPGVGSFDLRQFPPGDSQRFHEAVMHGKNAMPAHDDILTDADVDALFAYVVATQQAHKP